MGTTTATGQLLRHSVGLMECLDQVRRDSPSAGGDGIAKLSRYGNAHWHGAEVHDHLWARANWPQTLRLGLGGRLQEYRVGRGAPDKAEAEVEVYADGRAEIRTSSAEWAKPDRRFGRLYRRRVGLPFPKVNALVMDTDLTPDGGPTTASRQTYVSGNAAALAARRIARSRLQSVLAEKFDVPPDVIAFHEGLAYVDEERLAPLKAADGSNGHNGDNGHPNSHANGANGTEWQATN